jgi:hypothetical protein
MIEKFDRIYTLTIDPDAAKGEPEKIEISERYAIEFTIIRNTNSSANTGIFKIKNRTGTLQRNEYKDRYETNQRRRIVFAAGYPGIEKIVFSGDITEISRWKDSQDFVTEIKAAEGNFVMANIRTDIESRAATLGDVFGILAERLELPLIIGKHEQPLERNKIVLSGNTWELLKEYAPGECQLFIDGDRLVILRKNEAFEGDIEKITPDMGILTGFPDGADDLLEFGMLFEPRLVVGQAVGLEGLTERNADDEKYRINAIEHSAVKEKDGAGSKWSTKVSLQRMKGDIIIIK